MLDAIALVGGSRRRPRTHYQLFILFEKTPQHAPELVRAIYNAPHALLTSPHRGRPGKKEGTRELVLSPLPYIVIYRIAGDAIHIIRILHGAQKWP
ncbi:MAG TPA: type II toxin-antitoxin system RelE/ParE family toxin [Bryobacteraceae bacterium]